MRSERRKLAEKAAEEYNKLSLEQKLARLPAVGAVKQRTRLEALIEAAKKPAKKVEVATEQMTEVVDAIVVEKSKPKKGKKQS
jgi:hypothetical protein